MVTVLRPPIKLLTRLMAFRPAHHANLGSGVVMAKWAIFAAVGAATMLVGSAQAQAGTV
ncbi:MAG: hypothetical protein U9R07_09245 [Pseudomonadota bacterium]|nr:hypothetical protein [Pseudomonadota bacterium]